MAGQVGDLNKIPIVAAVTLNEAEHPTYARIRTVRSFSSDAIADCATTMWHPATRWSPMAWPVLDPAPLRGKAIRPWSPVGSTPNGLPLFRWNNTLQSNLRISVAGAFDSFNFDKYARRYLNGYCFRINRRLSMAAMTERIANAVSSCIPCTEWDLRVGEAYG